MDGAQLNSFQVGKLKSWQVLLQKYDAGEGAEEKAPKR